MFTTSNELLDCIFQVTNQPRIPEDESLRSDERKAEVSRYLDYRKAVVETDSATTDDSKSDDTILLSEDDLIETNETIHKKKRPLRRVNAHFHLRELMIFDNDTPDVETTSSKPMFFVPDSDFEVYDSEDIGTIDSTGRSAISETDNEEDVSHSVMVGGSPSSDSSDASDSADSLENLTSEDETDGDSDSKSVEEEVGECSKDIIVHGRNVKESRKDLCVFCKRYILTTGFVRHLERKHRSERRVLEIIAENKGSNTRKRKIQMLRNSGNHIHNTKVFKSGGALIVIQKPKKTTNLSQGTSTFVLCRRCLGLYSRRDVWRHSCPNEKADDQKLTIKSSLLMLRFDSTAQSKFFRKMKKTENLITIKNDELMCRYINEQLTRKGMKRYSTVRNEINLMCTLLHKIRNIKRDYSVTMKTALTPIMFDALHSAIMIMFNYNVDDEDGCVSMKTPSCLIKLCQGLMKICVTLHVWYLKQSAEEAVKKTTDEAILLEKELRPLMNNATQNLRSATSGLPEDLPNPQQMISLKNHLHELLNRLQLTKEHQKSLKEASLTYLILFNKRRSSEVANLKITSWNLRSKWKKQALEEMHKLDSTEQVLVKTLEVVYVKGKGNKFVPILFPHILVPIITWLASIGETYIFENEAQNPIRGNDAVRHMATDAGIRPRSLTSTKLRKLAATTLQLQNFNDVDYRVLCDHFGHTLPVHNRWYRMRTSTVELTKVAKMLMHDFGKKNAAETEQRPNDDNSLETDTYPKDNQSPDPDDVDQSPDLDDADRSPVKPPHERNKKKKKTVKPRTWTSQQTDYLRIRCGRNIDSNTTLRKTEAEKIINEMPVLFKHRNWKDIKNKVRNEALSRRRQ